VPFRSREEVPEIHPSVKVKGLVIGNQLSKLGSMPFTVYDRLIKALQLDSFGTLEIEAILFMLLPLCPYYSVYSPGRYGIGYNDLDDCHYRYLVLLGATMLELILTPFQEGKRSGQSFVIQLLKCVFSVSSSNNKS